MTLTFMSIVSVIVCEKVDEKLGRTLLIPLCIVGVGSVSWWSFTESHQDYVGDLRLYILVQVAPVFLTPLLVYMYPARYTHSEMMYVCAFLYVLSKAAELFDHGVWALSYETMSGHSLKHFLAALGTTWIPNMIRKRRIIKIK